MKFVQKLGKALMLPVACLPICGILMGLGYAMCPSTMQGGDVTGVVEQIGFFLVKAGGALIDHMALLFAIGVGVGMSDDHDGTAGLAALASWLMITNLLSTGAVSVLRTLEEGSTAFIAFSKIENPFIGIIAGIIIIDIGMQCIQLSNQTSIFELNPRASNRINTVFMTTYFIGGSMGTFLAGSFWQLYGWHGVISIGVVLTGISLLITIFYKK